MEEKDRHIGEPEEEKDDVEAHQNKAVNIGEPTLGEPTLGDPTLGKTIHKDDEDDDVEAHVHLNSPKINSPKIN